MYMRFRLCYKMWAIPTGTSSVLKKKNQVKSPSPESRVPETGSDPPIRSDRESGCDNMCFIVMIYKKTINTNTFSIYYMCVSIIISFIIIYIFFLFILILLL